MTFSPYQMGTNPAADAEITALRTRVAELESQSRATSEWRHIANEWADAASNGIQWLRNIQDGISTPDEGIKEMLSNFERIREIPRPPVNIQGDSSPPEAPWEPICDIRKNSGKVVMAIKGENGFHTLWLSEVDNIGWADDRKGCHRRIKDLEATHFFTLPPLDRSAS